MNTMFNLLQAATRMTGIWDGPREHTHAFQLTPDVYRVSPENQRVLHEFGLGLRDVLAGVGRIAAIAQNRKIASGPTWARVRRLLAVGVPKAYHHISVLRPGTGPALCKVDFMERPNGTLCVAEIDGHNKHGMGYSRLGALLRSVTHPTAQGFPGVARALANEVRSLGTNRLVLLSGHHERFYLAEFAIIAEALRAHEIQMTIVEELDDRTIEEHILEPSRRERVLLVDFPFLTRNTRLNTLLPRAYAEGRIDFIFQPKPFLGSKALLGLIRNEEEDPMLEAILRSQIHPIALKRVRDLIPATYLMGKAARTTHWRDLAEQEGWIIKNAISNGMKGMAFPGDPSYKTFLHRAAASYDHAVLQQVVLTRPYTLRSFTRDGTEEVGTWYLRITGHFTRTGVADLALTARKDRSVHGAKDALLFGAAFAEPAGSL